MTAERTNQTKDNGAMLFVRAVIIGAAVGYLTVEASQISPKKIVKAISQKLTIRRDS